ncbi:MAG: hypothetical protein D6689_03795 [Deltaproteobacteria bacterium]|nr:MAG: hypothetical protein D6689_03795 [Deltaproteobacteria bacterium]
MRAVLVHVLIAAARIAAPGYTFTPPADAIDQPALADTLAATVGAQRHFGGAARVTARAFVARGRYAVYVFDIRAAEPAENPTAAIRAGLDEIRAAPADPTSPIAAGETVSYRERADRDVVTAALVWRHASNETITRVRAWLWIDSDGRARQVRAECVVAEADDAAYGPRCDAALAAVEPLAANRKPLPPIPPPATTASPPPAPPPALAPATAPAVAAADAPAAPLYRAPPPAPSAGRWGWIAAGAALVAAALYTARRARHDPTARAARANRGDADRD